MHYYQCPLTHDTSVALTHELEMVTSLTVLPIGSTRNFS